MVYRIEGVFDSKKSEFNYTVLESNKSYTDFNNDNFMNDYICRSKNIFYKYFDSKEELKNWLHNCVYNTVRIF